MLLSVVGAFQWKGGYQEYLPDLSFQTGTEHESYLGEAFLEHLKHRRHEFRVIFLYSPNTTQNIHTIELLHFL